MEVKNKEQSKKFHKFMVLESIISFNCLLTFTFKFKARNKKYFLTKQFNYKAYLNKNWKIAKKCFYYIILSSKYDNTKKTAHSEDH